MASFKNHLFISYTHIDNEHFSGTSLGWIDHLHERLEIRLAQLLGTAPTIWRDRKLRGNYLIDETFVIELSRTEILLSVVTPRYLKSTACLSEVQTFCRQASEQGGVHVGDKHRVFKVIKTYVPADEQSSEFRGVLGYEFYQSDQTSGRVREFDHEVNARGEKDKRYWDKFEDLAWDVHEMVKRLEGRTAADAQRPSATIYLAETTSDLSDERDRVKRELQQFGYLVLPDKPLPLKAPDLLDAVRAYLSRSRLSVHFIGEHYGVIPEMESDRSVVRVQQELARDRVNGDGFQSLIWMPPGLAPEDERQHQFVADLKNSVASRPGSELLQVKLEDLKTILHGKLIQEPKPAKAVDGAVRVYLICGREDVDAVDQIRNYLFDQGYEVTLPLLDGGEIDVLQDHKEGLLLCDAVLIYWGRASEGWLRMKLRDLLKLPGYGRVSPLLGKVVYIGAPESPTKDRFKTHEALVIMNSGEFNPESLDPLLAEIQKAKGAWP